MDSPLMRGPSSSHGLLMLDADTMSFTEVFEGSFFSDEAGPTFATAP